MNEFEQGALQANREAVRSGWGYDNVEILDADIMSSDTTTHAYLVEVESGNVLALYRESETGEPLVVRVPEGVNTLDEAEWYV